MAAKKAKTDPLADAMIARLHALREFNADGGIITARELAEQAAESPSEEAIKKAIKTKPFQAATVSPDYGDITAPLALISDAQLLAASDQFVAYLKKSAKRSAGAPFLVKDLAAKIKAGKNDPAQQHLKQAFEAVATEAVQSGRWPEVTLKPTPPEEAMAANLLRVLRSQRSLGPKSYPLTLQRLAELSEIDALKDKKSLAKALKHESFGPHVFQVGSSKQKPLDALVALKDDVEQLAAAEQVLVYALNKARTKTTLLVTIAAMAKKLPVELQPRFQQTWTSDKLRQGRLPEGVVGIDGKEPKLFLVQDLIPSGLRERLSGAATKPAPTHSPTPVREPMTTAAPSAPPRREGNGDGAMATQSATATLTRPQSGEWPAERLETFAREFDAAFVRLDHHRGGYNLVSLADLRSSLPTFSTVEFNAHLRELRKRGVYSLSEGQSKHGIPEQERNAGILEAGNLLIYASRRTS